MKLKKLLDKPLLNRGESQIGLHSRSGLRTDAAWLSPAVTS
jgi:hypothetical protein